MNNLSIYFNKFFFFKRKKELAKFKNILDVKKIYSLEKALGFLFKTPSLYIKALTHRSFLENNEDFKKSNERLEFLGDAVLDLVVAKKLFLKYPLEYEGYMTQTRANLVNKHALFKASHRLFLEDYLFVSKNFLYNFPNGSESVLADAYESLIGAIYLDRGMKYVLKFIDKTLLKPSFTSLDYLVDKNYKSQLLEFTQKNKLEKLEYCIVSEYGPQHNKSFTIQVKINDEIYGLGKGKNKKSAEQNAAKNALEKRL